MAKNSPARIGKSRRKINSMSDNDEINGLHGSMVRQGRQIFRWRGHLPLLFLLPAAFAVYQNFHLERLICEHIEDIWGTFAFMVSMIGIALRAFTVGYVPKNTSGRNTVDQRADVLNVSGMYSVCRNPLYLANAIIIFGVLLWAKVWFLGIIVMLAFFVYMERIIMAEEAYLHQKFGDTYDTWRKHTPVLIPKYELWRKPDLDFSWKTVLKREYPGLLAVSTIFIVLHFVFDIWADKETVGQWVSHDYPAVVLYGVIVVFCLTLRFLKRNTSVLKVEGR